MSWTASLPTPVEKLNFERAINDLVVQTYGDQPNCPAADQVKMAKAAAKELCKGMPGPLVNVSMAGHANGVGWQKKEGYANDCITVSVTQCTEPAAA